MTYLIIDHVSNKVLLSAYFHPENTYYIDTHLCKDFEQADCNGQVYMLDNIIFGEPETQPDAVIWDEMSLSVEDVVKLNEFLEIDKPAYVGNIYCDELKQLLEYEPFLGNYGCKVPEEMGIANKKSAFLSKYQIIKDIDFIDTLDDIGYNKILTIGDFQKLVPEEKVLVYKPVEDIDTDIENIKKIISNNETMAFIGSVSNTILNNYYAELIEKVHDNIKFDEHILCTSVHYYMTTNLELDLNDYDKLLLSDRLCHGAIYCSQYEQIHYGRKNYITEHATEEAKKKIIHCNFVGKEFITFRDYDFFKFSDEYRRIMDKIYSDYTDEFARVPSNKYPDLNTDAYIENTFRSYVAEKLGLYD